MDEEKVKKSQKSKDVLLDLIEKEQRKKEYRHLIMQLCMIAFVVFIFFRMLFGIAIIDGTSMQPFLKNGGGVIFSRFQNKFNREDIVIFPLEGNNELLVKRVKGIAGDLIDLDIQNGILYVNGEAEKQNYYIGATYPFEGGVQFPLTVDEGKVFVLGDNRLDSKDSRWFGLVNITDIKGSAIFQWSSISSE